MITNYKYPFLGVSPDGITDNGKMLEIKCPFSRNIDGKIKLCCKKCKQNSIKNNDSINYEKIISMFSYIKFHGIEFNFCKVCEIMPIVQYSFHAGHDTPRSGNGLSSEGNLEPSCMWCNLKMSDNFTITNYKKVINLFIPEQSDTFKDNYKNVIKALGNYYTTGNIEFIISCSDSLQYFLDLQNQNNIN